MVSGAFVIGRDLTLAGFDDMREHLKEARRFQKSFFYKPIEVGLPYYFTEPEKWKYTEGVLVLATLRNGNAEGLERDVKGYIARAAGEMEKVYCSAEQNGREWACDHELEWVLKTKLHHQQLARDNIDGKKVVWEPFYTTIKIFDDKVSQQEYLAIASDLIIKTRDARTAKYMENQHFAADKAMGIVLGNSGIENFV